MNTADKFLRVGAEVIPQWNADQILSVPVDDTSKGHNKILKYNSTTQKLEYGADESTIGTHFSTICGYNGNAGVGKWLQFMHNISSDHCPYVVAGNINIIAMASYIRKTSTIEFSIYKNGVYLDKIVTTSAKKTTKIDLSHSLSIGDEISMKVTSGSALNPIINIFYGT